MINTKKKIGYLILLFLISASTFQIFTMNTTKNFKDENNHKQIQTSAQESYVKQWIVNPLFTSTDNWTSSKGQLGDPNDVGADISGGQANYEVLGKIGRKEISDPINIANKDKWQKFNKTEPAINPDTAIIDDNGFYVSHSWHDATADQFATVYWRYNVSMDVDMSEYNITSASLNATMYANVDPNIDTEYDTYARFGPDYLIDQPGIFDHAFFFVEIADLDITSTYRIAFNQTSRLGKDTAPTFYTIETKSIEPEGDEQDLIYFLNKVFDKDPDHNNFTIIVGIRIDCEDDYTGQDFDDWSELRIKSLNLTFNYEKKIDQFTSISWNQEGDKPSDLSSDTVVVDEAILNFEYKVNDTWPTLSPNSEFRMLINDVTHTETIKISSADLTFKEAISGGFDITYLIDEDKNINLSIQAFIADDFELNRTIEISIYNVTLDVSYTIIFPDYTTNLQLFLNGDDKTSSPSIILPIGQNLTITVEYNNQTGGHVQGAEVQLTGEGIIENLKEYTDYYSITFNVTQELSIGINYLNIEAKKPNYQTELINPTITVRKIDTDIITVSGESNINIDVGEDAQLEIMLNDTDNDELIRGAIVTYTWNLDPIPRVLTENNGIYEGEIENPPEGLYTITISVFVSEDYEFEDFEITLNVGAYIPATQPDFGWLIYILIGAILGLVLIFTLYQTHFKFPPMVRKIRKLKKNVRKTKKTKQIIVNTREQLIKDNRENRIKDLNLEQLENGGKIEKIPINKEEEI